MNVYRDRTGSWFASVTCYGVASGKTKREAEKKALEDLREAYRAALEEFKIISNAENELAERRRLAT